MKPAGMRILLTGASGGIGQATAQALVQAGASVMLTGRSPARLSAQARQLVQRPGQDVAWYDADLQDAGALAMLAHAATAWNCDTVVHGAGAASFGAAAAMLPGEAEATIATNLLAPIRLTQALLPHLAQQPSARLLFIGSVLGAIGLPGYSLYCASKFGLRGYAQALRRELDGSGLRVQYLGPRTTRTAFNSAAAEHYQQATGAAVDTPERVAAAVLRMLADGAAERFLGFPEKLAVRVNGAASALLDGAFASHRKALAAEGTAPGARFTPT